MNQASLQTSPGGRGWIKLVFEFVGVMAFVIMFASTLLGVIARYFEFGGVEWSFEVASIAFIWITFVGVVNAEMRRENVAFEAINHASPPRIKAFFDAVAAAALLTMGMAFLFSGWAVWQRSWMVPTSVLRLPTGIITATVLVLGVSAVCMALSRLAGILATLRTHGGKAGAA
ncbi:C4-dicarboxylate ABC transporter [Rhodoferax koreense]|uniref:TRAP transporter small permease protein n=1 Tax=Rhodoferax koreensis TaxID=1842727 RepID=A0A1P8K0X5_9BURK|nr:TRAP transporter small permease subunit [Rhodoferax koreense]APW39663.1 C4-dicarboxylate ABC transporter [Rhodoferax koreense]